MRSKLVVPIAVLAGLLLAALALWYTGRPARVKAYYTKLFADAQTITISRSSHLRSIAPAGSKTLHRRDHPDTFKLFEEAVRDGQVRKEQCQCVISWQLQLTDAAGHTTKVGVAHYLFTGSQPAAHGLWFYPMVPGHDENGFIEECDALMGVKVTPPARY